MRLRGGKLPALRLQYKNNSTSAFGAQTTVGGCRPYSTNNTVEKPTTTMVGTGCYWRVAKTLHGASDDYRRQDLIQIRKMWMPARAVPAWISFNVH